MDTTRFADDLRLIPDSLDSLADAIDAGLPGLEDLPSASRVVVLGMGSSAYAAADSARRARLRGLNVTVELASVTALPEPADDLVVVAVSATGGSAEVLEAISRYEGTGRLVGVTNRTDSALAQRSDVVIPLLAGVEESSVACRTFRHTAPVLDEILHVWSPDPDRDSAGRARRAAAASRMILAESAEWLGDLSDALRGPDGSWVLAPADRFASAQQSALMMREVPRRPAYACETGDWAHVDVYLTKTLDYRALVFAGSRWDDQAVEWMEQRCSRWFAVGGEVRGAEMTIPLPDGEPGVRLLSETLVAELVAERWRAEDPDFSWSSRV